MKTYCTCAPIWLLFSKSFLLILVFTNSIKPLLGISSNRLKTDNFETIIILCRYIVSLIYQLVSLFLKVLLQYFENANRLNIFDVLGKIKRKKRLKVVKLVRYTDLMVWALRLVFSATLNIFVPF